MQLANHKTFPKLATSPSDKRLPGVSELSKGKLAELCLAVALSHASKAEGLGKLWLWGLRFRSEVFSMSA